MKRGPDDQQTDGPWLGERDDGQKNRQTVASKYTVGFIAKDEWMSKQINRFDPNSRRATFLDGTNPNGPGGELIQMDLVDGTDQILSSVFFKIRVHEF